MCGNMSRYYCIVTNIINILQYFVIFTRKVTVMTFSSPWLNNLDIYPWLSTASSPHPNGTPSIIIKTPENKKWSKGPVDKSNQSREVDNQTQWPDKYQMCIVGMLSSLRPWSGIVLLAFSDCLLRNVYFDKNRWHVCAMRCAPMFWYPLICLGAFSGWFSNVGDKTTLLCTRYTHIWCDGARAAEYQMTKTVSTEGSIWIFESV